MPGTARHTMPPIRILIADDHTLMRQGLRQLCEGMGGFTVVAEAEDGAQAVALARTTQPDVILMDIVMPDVDGVEAIRQIMAETPAARIIALTMYRQEQYMLDAIRAGARGYLLKTVDARDLIAAIEAVHRGDYLIDPIIAARVLSELHLDMPPQAPRAEPLTEGEMAVLRLVAQGVENQEIAQALNYSVYTVANRLRTIYEKLHVTNRTQAALLRPAPGLGHAGRAARVSADWRSPSFLPVRTVRHLQLRFIVAKLTPKVDQFLSIFRAKNRCKLRTIRDRWGTDITYIRRITMINLSVRHTVADYAKWRASFDAHESMRRAGGSTGVFQVYRDVENPNQITVMAEWDNAENAWKFASDPALKEAMEDGGVTSMPEVHFLNRA